MKTAEQACADLRDYVEAENFSGYDPYDALNSPFLRAVSLGLKWPRIAVIQAVKRCPLNLRPLLLVKKGHNPKGMGLFLWSYTKLYKATGDEAYKKRAYEILGHLKNLKSAHKHGHGWGYNFDWQSKAFFVPKGTPTIVNTSFVGHALLDSYEAFGDEQFLNLALPARDFILNDLHRTPYKSENGHPAFCFSYTPLDQLIVHNANLLGASLLMRLHHYRPSHYGREEALAALNYTMSHQRDDGSWWYADTHYQKWIDSFHTGFNLHAISYFFELGEAENHKKAYERGIEFYADNFFKTDGTAKYFHDRLLPEDIHSYAQAVVFFSRLGERYRPLVDTVCQKMLTDFQDPSGYFYFQRRKGKPIKISYMRWTQSWAFHALSEYILNKPDSAETPDNS